MKIDKLKKTGMLLAKRMLTGLFSLIRARSTTDYLLQKYNDSL